MTRNQKKVSLSRTCPSLRPPVLAPSGPGAGYQKGYRLGVIIEPHNLANKSPNHSQHKFTQILKMPFKPESKDSKPKSDSKTDAKDKKDSKDTSAGSKAAKDTKDNKFAKGSKD